MEDDYVLSLNRPESYLTNSPGHLWRDKWAALSGLLSLALSRRHVSLDLVLHTHSLSHTLSLTHSHTHTHTHTHTQVMREEGLGDALLLLPLRSYSGSVITPYTLQPAPYTLHLKL